MTVIAWDGKTLAADKRSVLHGKPTTVTKLFKVNGWLLAISGDLVKGLELIEWFRNGRDPKELPASQRSKEDYVPMLAISPAAELFHFEDSPIPFKVEDLVYAMGSGRDYALAAMHLGCDARRAVGVACALNNGCGNGVDALTLHPEVRPRRNAEPSPGYSYKGADRWPTPDAPAYAAPAPAPSYYTPAPATWESSPAPAPVYEPPAPSPSFSSGGGGDFSGGGATGEW